MWKLRTQKFRWGQCPDDAGYGEVPSSASALPHLYLSAGSIALSLYCKGQDSPGTRSVRGPVISVRQVFFRLSCNLKNRKFSTRGCCSSPHARINALTWRRTVCIVKTPPHCRAFKGITRITSHGTQVFRIIGVRAAGLKSQGQPRRLFLTSPMIHHWIGRDQT